MENQTHTETYVMLELGLAVPRWLHDSILELVTEAAPLVDPRCGHRLEILCGEEFWTPLSNWHRRLAGRCMAYMVEHERVPFCFAGHPCETPKKYMPR